MAKLGAANVIGISKLKSVMKRLNSLKSSREGKRSVTPYLDGGGDDHLHTVYVGRSRRRFLVTATVARHPLFRELVERSAAAEHGARSPDHPLAVTCEVVLFEHLLWMLENADNEETGSLDSLVEFYTC